MIENPNVVQVQSEEEEKEKKKKIIIILLILIIIALLGVLGYFGWKLANNNHPTAVIEKVDEKLNLSDKNGQLRIKINPTINIKNDTMQNLMFYNLNKNRLMQCKIKVGNKYVYKSCQIGENQVIKGDFIETKYLKKGHNEALAEIYSYTNEKDLIGQTNVKLVLNLE